MVRRAAGETPLCFVLIPDEFQVEDRLWRELTAERLPGVELDRGLPQRVIGAWLADRGVPCLDLLPHLRSVEPTADGDRHVYHRQDTHFKARGNRVAGEALAAFLRPILR